MAKEKGTDYRLLFERDFIGAWDLLDRDVTVTIDSVKVEEITGEGGRKEKCPVLRMRGKKKSLVLNITNARTIAALHGKNIEGWVGKQITLYPTTCQFGRNTVDCVRVRLVTNPNAAPTQDEPELGDDDEDYVDPGPPDTSALRDWEPTK